MRRMTLKKLYDVNGVKVGIYQIEADRAYYIAVLIDGLNLEVWGMGETAYQALLDARERWNDNFGGFNPFREALSLFP